MTEPMGTHDVTAPQQGEDAAVPVTSALSGQLNGEDPVLPRRPRWRGVTCQVPDG